MLGEDMTNWRSIRVRLLGAFILVAGLTALSAIVAGFALNSTKRSVQEVSLEKFPQATLIGDLSNLTKQMGTKLMELELASNHGSRETAFQEFQATVAEAQIIQAKLGNFAEQSEQFGEIPQAIEKISALAQKLNAAKIVRLDARNLRMNQVTESESVRTDLGKALETAIDQANDADVETLLRTGMAAGIIATGYFGLDRATTHEQVDAIQESFLEQSDEISINLAIMRASLDASVKFQVDQFLSFGTIDDNVFAARKQELDALTTVKNTEIEANVVVANLIQKMRLAVDDVRGEAQTSAEATVARTQIFLVGLAILALCSITVAAAVGRFYVSQTLIARIVNLSSAMDSVSKGNLSVSIDKTDANDELDEMAQALSVFRENAERVNRLNEEKAAEAEKVEAMNRQQLAKAEEQANVVQTLAGALKQVAEGDLTSHIPNEFPEAYKQLRSDFNASIAELKEALLQIGQKAGSLQAGAGEMSQAAADLSDRTENQAATLETTASAVDQIAATVRQTAEGASEADRAVHKTQDDVAKGGEVVREAVDAMAEIQSSSNQISQITGLIEDIAHQTNLLALNASVEAARAGDSGKGFAVVAQEVRALAQRSSEAAKEIKDLIAQSAKQVQTGVALVNQTGQSLEAIVDHISGVKKIVTNIANGAKEQSLGLDEINTAMNQMDHVTQQNVAMVEESTAASRSMSEEANELVGLISRFKMGAPSQRDLAPMPQLQADAGRAAAPTPLKHMAERMRGSAPQAEAQVVATNDDWKEF